MTTQTLAQIATLARKDLKSTYPQTRFSVRSLHSTTLAIAWTDGPTEHVVTDLLARYKGWHRDPATGCYIPRPDRTPVAVARYLTTSRTPSGDRQTALAAGLRASNPGLSFATDNPLHDTTTAPESLTFEGRRYYRPYDHADLGMLVRQIFDHTNA